jgi:MFS family permease
MPTYLAFVVVLVPMGIAFMTYVTTLNATFQLTVEPHMRGRVMSMFLLVFMGVAPIGAPVVGFLADTFGPQTSMVIGGAFTVVVVSALAVPLFRVKGVHVRDLLPSRRRGEPAAAGPVPPAEPAGPEADELALAVETAIEDGAAETPTAPERRDDLTAPRPG